MFLPKVSMKRPRLRLPKLTRPALSPAAVNVLVFCAGLLLLAVGLSLWYLPAGLVGAGAVLLYVTLFGGGGEKRG